MKFKKEIILIIALFNLSCGLKGDNVLGLVGECDGYPNPPD